MSKKTYEVIADAPGGVRIGDRRRRKGEKIELTSLEAEFLVLDGVIALAETAQPKPPRKSVEG